MRLVKGSRTAVLLTITLWTAFSRDARAENGAPPSLHTPTRLEEWAARGFGRLDLPKLGETDALVREINGNYRILPGVNYNPPEFPKGYYVTSNISSVDVFESNRARIYQRMSDYGPEVAIATWIQTQTDTLSKEVLLRAHACSSLPDDDGSSGKHCLELGCR
jgi:hypothetical protein